MSKIKLTGENSGYVEISAGQNAGNNTLELPTSGTKVVASDDSGNVNNLGIVTATTFSGNVEGNVTGNADTATTALGITTSQITVGESFIKSNSIGIGSTSTAGRNAGINTAVGTIIYNATTNSVEAYGPSGWVSVQDLSGDGITATGGITATYTDGDKKYKSHTFLTSNPFQVTSLGDRGNLIDCMVVGGGGGGGGTPDHIGCGGGGAGGMLVSTGILVATGSYPVVVGGGGAGGTNGPGAAGVNSELNLPSALIAAGGGFGAGRGGYTSSAGGSGGGAVGYSAPTTGSAGNTYPSSSPTPAPLQGQPAPGQGNPGGDGGTTGNKDGGGGGGAGQAGTAGEATAGVGGGPGGDGLANTYRYGPSNPVTYAGGGGGGADPDYATGNPAGSGGSGGGGAGKGDGTNGVDGTTNTGGGGGGGGHLTSNGGTGGSGIVVIRYEVSPSQN